jgi:hypothetical protein
MADSLKMPPISGLAVRSFVIAEQLPQSRQRTLHTLTVVPRYEHFLHA